MDGEEKRARRCPYAWALTGAIGDGFAQRRLDPDLGLPPTEVYSTE